MSEWHSLLPLLFEMMFIACVKRKLRCMSRVPLTNYRLCMVFFHESPQEEIDHLVLQLQMQQHHHRD